MRILDKITEQISAIGLPLYAVTLTAVPRVDTPLLLMLHWHGFRREVLGRFPGLGTLLFPVPGSALQLNERWQSLAMVESAMLDAAWQLGAWDVERLERRACNHVCATEQEAYECRQAFGEHPLNASEEVQVVADAADRADLMRLGAEVGYLRWLFRPVQGGLWQKTAEDDTLAPDGSRAPPCPVVPLSPKGGKAARTTYRLGRINRILLP